MSNEKESAGTLNITLVQGDIVACGGMPGVFARIAEVPDTGFGLLRILSKEATGRIGVYKGRQITGALVVKSGQTGLAALNQLLVVQQGLYAFVPAEESDMNELLQSLSLAVDLAFAQIGGQSPHAPSVANEDPGTKSNSLSFLTDYSQDAESLYSAADQLLTLPDGTVSSVLSQPEELLLEHGVDLSQSKVGKVLAILSSTGNHYSLKSMATFDDFNVQSNQDSQPIEPKDIPSNNAANFARSANAPNYVLNNSTPGDSPSSAALDEIQAPPVVNRRNSEFALGTSQLIDKKMADQAMQRKQFMSKSIKDRQGQEAFPNRYWRSVYITLTALITVTLAIVLGILATSITTYSWSTRQLQDGLESLHTGHYQQAIQDFSVSLGTSRSDRTLFYRALSYLGARQYEAALADLKKLADRGNHWSGLYQAKGRAYLGLNNNYKVIQAESEAIKLDPSTPGPYLLRATAKLAVHHPAQTIADCNRALTLSLTQPWMKVQFYALSAAAQFQLGKFAAAKQDYDNAILAMTQPMPQQSRLYLGRGLCLAALLKYKAAIADFDLALSLDPKALVTYYHRGLCFKALEQYPQAISDFTQCIDHYIFSANSFRQRAYCNLKSGSFHQALIDYDQALAIVPNMPNAGSEREIAIKHLSQGKELQIAQLATNETDLDRSLPKDPLKLTDMGYKALQSGNTNLAVACLTRAVIQQPRRAAVRRYLAYAFIADKQYDAAFQQFDLIKQLGQATDKDALAYAEGLRLAKHVHQCIALLQAFLKNHPDDQEATAILSKAYADLDVAAENAPLVDTSRK